MRNYLKLVFLFIGSLVIGLNLSASGMLEGYEERFCLMVLIVIGAAALLVWRNPYMLDLVEILAGLPAGMIILRRFDVPISFLLAIDTIMVIITIVMIILWGNSRTGKNQDQE